MALDKSNWGAINLRFKGQRSRSLGSGNENVKIVFCSYLCQKWIDLHTSYQDQKPKGSSTRSTHIVEYISSTECLVFEIFVCRLIIRDGRMSQQSPGHAPNCCYCALFKTCVLATWLKDV